MFYRNLIDSCYAVKLNLTLTVVLTVHYTSGLGESSAWEGQGAGGI